MKKWLILLFILLVIMPFGFRNVNAASKSGADYSDYKTFSYMQFSKGKLLSNYSNSELKPYIKKAGNRKFYGWRISYINKHVRCNFTSKTILQIVNDGTSDIKYQMEKTETKLNKVSISAKGSLKTSTSGTIKKFKCGLDTALNIERDQEESITCKTSESLTITIDPGTKVYIYLKGSGYLTNGYAVFYDTWLKRYAGAFEFFELVDVYPKIVKEKL